MKIRNVLAAGVVGLVMGCDSTYVGAGDYSCEKFGDTITARRGDTEVEYIGNRSTLSLDYSEDLTNTSAMKIIDDCKHGFGKLEKEVDKEQAKVIKHEPGFQ